jgi:hypothetical protein
MYIIGLIIILIIVFTFYIKPYLKSSHQDNANIGNIVNEDIMPPIPKGFQKYVYSINLHIAGIKYRKADALKFARSVNKELTMERDPDNENDPNAIRLIGISGLKNIL